MSLLATLKAAWAVLPYAMSTNSPTFDQANYAVSLPENAGTRVLTTPSALDDDVSFNTNVRYSSVGNVAAVLARWMRPRAYSLCNVRGPDLRTRQCIMLRTVKRCLPGV